MVRVPVKPAMIQWAIDRSRRDPMDLAARFDKLDDWLQGSEQPTLKQLETFAAATHAPIGYFFLDSAPPEPLPIPDFRTIGSGKVNGGKGPSPDLLDTIYLCQQRQDWYRTNALVLRDDPVGFVGAATVQSDTVATARAIRAAVGFDLNSRAEANTFEDALRMMIDTADKAGILVMVSGVVGGNSHRALDVTEFRGFALADDLAPLIFINGTDTKSGQMFTLAHELAHLWLGQSGVSDASASSVARAGNNAGTGSSVETWCNAVAAEMLVPLESFKVVYKPEADLNTEKQRLARHYKVSTLVILRRMLDAGGLTREAFGAAYAAEVKQLQTVMAKRKEAGGGGDFYATAKTRVSPRFARALLAATWEGRSTFTEAFRMLGCKNVKTLEGLGDRLGMNLVMHGGAV